MLSNRAVTSREYKLILNVRNFLDREDGIRLFWDMVRSYASHQRAKAKTRRKKDSHRQTWYLDTPGLALRRNGYVLRLRQENEQHKLTLKFRDSDRYLAAAVVLSSTDSDAKTKFEEDILPPFRSKFSHSTAIEKPGAAPKLKAVGDLLTLFPKLDLDALEVRKRSPLQRVSDFKANELAVRLGKLDFDGATEVKATLSFWYIEEIRERQLPLVAEFSFDYDAPESDGKMRLETFPRPVVAGANRLFQALQRQSGWINPNFTTKTAFAYDGF